MVSQQAFLHEHENIQLDKEGIATLVGFVGPGSDGPTLVCDSYPAPGVPADVGCLLGPAGEVLLALDRDEPLGLSTGWDYRPDGRARRTWVPLVFRDGVSVTRLPKGSDPATLRVAHLPFRGSRTCAT